MTMSTLHYCTTLIALVLSIGNHATGEIVTCGGKISPHHNGDCQVWYDYMKCVNKSALLSIGHCMTNKEGEGTYAMECTYFQLKGHKIPERGYIKLPRNISDLNDYMCQTMNRKGFLCKDCIHGFGPSWTSVGFKCSNCTGMWYGVPLYLLLQFAPPTLFYLIILAFRIHLASAPMTCFIMYSQLLSQVLYYQQPPINEILHSPLFKITAAFYGIWNLDFIQYILPPFCISRHLQLSHIILLSYISSLYPMFLILLTWTLIKLHDHNFRPIVMLLRQIHRCFRGGLDTKIDMVDVFASFFLLSFSKIAYQSIVILQSSQITQLDERGNISCQHVLAYSPDISCNINSIKYIFIGIFAGLTMLVFNIFPALLLVLYPIRAFRVCLSRCKLDRLVIIIFVEKFHGCYRDGLHGGRDMRSFAGVYFFLRFVPFVFRINKYTVHTYGYSYIVLIFLTVSIITALARPYKRMYMNVFDTFLLADLTFLSHLMTRDYYRGEVVQIMILANIPALLLGGIAFHKLITLLKTKQRLINIWRSSRNYCCQEQLFRRYDSTHESVDSETRECHNEQSQLLMSPLMKTVDMKS